MTELNNRTNPDENSLRNTPIQGTTPRRAAAICVGGVVLYFFLTRFFFPWVAPERPEPEKVATRSAEKPEESAAPQIDSAPRAALKEFVDYLPPRKPSGDIKDAIVDFTGGAKNLTVVVSDAWAEGSHRDRMLDAQSWWAGWNAIASPDAPSDLKCSQAAMKNRFSTTPGTEKCGSPFGAKSPRR